MTQEEIKQKIATIEKAITALKNQEGYNPSQVKKLEDGKAKLEAMLEKETPPLKKEDTQPSERKQTHLAKKFTEGLGKRYKKKVIAKAKAENKTETKHKFPVGATVVYLNTHMKGTVIEHKPDLEYKVQWADNSISFPKERFILSEKEGMKQVLKKEKDISIEKDDKKETHTIDTAFDKDIKGAILTLNKHRFKVVEQKDKKTGKVEQVQHSPEYRNAKTIIKRVEAIFDSSVYDIAKTKKEKTEKKEIIEVINEIKDLTTLWINELDMIINDEDKDGLETIKKLLLGLVKEARKNDGDEKYRKAGGLDTLAKKYNL
jgi:hypothetical protein